MRALGLCVVAVVLLVGSSLGVSHWVRADIEPGFLPPEDRRVAGMVFLPAGPFLMGSSERDIESVHGSYGGSRAYYESEVPLRRVHLGAFYVDRTEVTQAQYKAFVDATGHQAPFVDRPWAALYNWNDGAYPDGLAHHPVVLVSYEDAEAYCGWAGKSLPTEREWEKAARGTEGRKWPWGETWERSRLNSAATWSDRELPTIEAWKTWWEVTYHGKLRGHVLTTLPVGSYPRGTSPYGALDMAGNVFEWTADWYDAYPGSPYENPEFGTQFKVIRGGDWYLDRIYTRAAARLRSPPDHKVPTIGFRCVCRPADASHQSGPR